MYLRVYFNFLKPITGIIASCYMSEMSHIVIVQKERRFVYKTYKFLHCVWGKFADVFEHIVKPFWIHTINIFFSVTNQEKIILRKKSEYLIIQNEGFLFIHSRKNMTDLDPVLTFFFLKKETRSLCIQIYSLRIRLFSLTYFLFLMNGKGEKNFSDY